jgi:hypothetical protein
MLRGEAKNTHFIVLAHSEILYWLGIFIRIVKIWANIAFLFYKEIYMKYLI